jgi:hypothetical protein
MSSKKCIIIFNTWTPTRDLGFGIWDFGFKGNEWLEVDHKGFGISDLRGTSAWKLTTASTFFQVRF